MNILGRIVTEASASVVRAPENVHLDDEKAKEEITSDDEQE